MSRLVVLSTRAQKDAGKLKAAGLQQQADRLIRLIERNPFATPPPYEKLLGRLAGMYSRRINIKHRLVYHVDSRARVVHVLRMWSHYE